MVFYNYYEISRRLILEYADVALELRLVQSILANSTSVVAKMLCELVVHFSFTRSLCMNLLDL